MKAYHDQNKTSERARWRENRGIVLIITLSLLVILTLIVIGYVTSARIERRAAAEYDRDVAAQSLAYAGVMRVMATLKVTIPGSATAGSFWASMPGMVMGYNGATFSLGFLYSGPSMTYVVAPPMRSAIVNLATTTDLVNLNETDWGGANPIIPLNDFYTVTAPLPGNRTYFGNYGTTSLMVGWVTVTAASGELIGRYAYWTDDNSARINVNSAFARSALQKIFDTSSIDLRNTGTQGSVFGLNTALAANVYRDPGTNLKNYYLTPEHMKWAQGMTNELYEANKFYFTAFGHEEEIDLFGRPRLNFNALTVTAPPPTINAELYSRLSYNVPTTFTYANGGTAFFAGPWYLFYPYATITADSPFALDLLSKYPMGGLQLIANMIDFTKPATLNCTVAPLITNAADNLHYGLPFVGTVSGSAITPIVPGFTATQTWFGYGYLGLKKGPYINEIICDSTATRTTSTLPARTSIWPAATVTFEIINPYDEPVAAGAYTLLATIDCTFTPSWGGNSFSYVGITNADARPLPAIPAKSYATVEITKYIAPGTSVTTFAISTGTISDTRFFVRQVRLVANAGNPYSLRDYVSSEALQQIGQYPINVPTITTTPKSNRVRAVCRDDPRVPNAMYAHALISGGSGSSPGAQNIITGNLFKDWGSLVADGAEVNNVLSHSTFYIPSEPLKNLGELGNLHTGAPWRTIRLRPMPSNELNIQAARLVTPKMVPDYALLDLFKLTDATTTSGRINVNPMLMDAFVYPPNTSSLSQLRRAPFYALLGDGIFNASPSLSGNPRGEMIEAIIRSANTSSNTYFFRRQGMFEGATGDWPIGLKPLAFELCEVPTLAFARTASPVTDEDREYFMRQIASFITARSNYFTVWSLGQTIKEVATVNGQFDPFFSDGVTLRDRITGQSLIQAVIERNPYTGAFRIIYYRALNE